MKYLSLFFVALLLTACNTDDNNDITLPEVEPIIANARVLNNGICGEDYYHIEIYDVQLNLSPNQTPSPYYGFYDW
ncbi:MAG: hypothetical protein WBA16_11190, partial [Nonlabens sp.]